MADESLRNLLEEKGLVHLCDKFAELKIESTDIKKYLEGNEPLIKPHVSTDELRKLREAFGIKGVFDEMADQVKQDQKQSSEPTVFDHIANYIETKKPKPAPRCAVKTKNETIDFVNLAYSRQINIVAIGKTGQGKSATLNSILKYSSINDDKYFAEDHGFSGVTGEIGQCCTNVDDLSLRLVDTVGLFDLKQNESFVLEQLSRCICLCSEGIHAFLVVFDGSQRFSKECKETLDIILKHFGSRLWDYVIVVITRADELSSDKRHSALQFLKDNNVLPSHFLNVFFDNLNRPREQVDELLGAIHQNVKTQQGPYTHQLFTEALLFMEQEKQKAIDEVNERKERWLEEEKLKIEEKRNKEIRELILEIKTREEQMVNQTKMLKKRKSELRNAAQIIEQQSQDAKLLAEEIGRLSKELEETKLQMQVIKENKRLEQRKFEEEKRALEQQIKKIENEKNKEFIPNNEKVGEFAKELNEKTRKIEDKYQYNGKRSDQCLLM